MEKGQRLYKADRIKIQRNRKTGEAGTIDIQRGCPGCELRNAPCYAAKGARMTNLNFFHPVKRIFDRELLKKQLKNYQHEWIRIGCISDPSLDWETTAEVAELCRQHKITPVIVSKIHKTPVKQAIEKLDFAEAQVQVSLSALMAGNYPKSIRRFIGIYCLEGSVKLVMRINSMAFPKGSNSWKNQELLVKFCHERELPILETPVRLFKTSPIWKLVDQKRYHRHKSPISGALDSQQTAGLVIPNAYPCFSTCSPIPNKETGDPGCPHQCVTKV